MLQPYQPSRPHYPTADLDPITPIETPRDGTEDNVRAADNSKPVPHEWISSYIRIRVFTLGWQTQLTDGVIRCQIG